MKRPLMGLGIALAAGVAAGWSGISWMILCVIIIMTGIILKRWTNSSYKYLLGLFVFFVVGFCRTMMNSGEEISMSDEIQGTIYRIEEKEKVHYLFMEDMEGQNILVIVDKTDYGKVNDENADDHNIRLSKRRYYKGQIYQVRGEAEAFEKPGNPGQFDEEAYYKSQGVVYRIWADEMILLNDGDRLSRSVRWLEDLKEKMCRFYEAHMTDAGNGILQAAVLGERGALDADLKRYYQENGWMHLITTSGLHLSFIAMFVYKRLRKMTVPLKASTITAFVLMTGYGYMTNFGDSMLRAMGMMVLGLMAAIFGRRTDIWTSLSVLAAGMLVLRPERILSVGFVLTYVAVGGMACGQWLNKQWVTSDESRVKSSMLKKHTWKETVWIQAGIFITTLPVLLCSMYEIPIFGFFYNFFMLPLISFVVPVAFVAGVLGVINVPLLKQLAVLALKLMDQMFIIIHKLPSKMWCCGCPARWQLVVFGAGMLVGILLFGHEKIRRGLVVMVMSCCFLMFVRIRMNQVIFMDVGQGDGICILTNEGQAVLVDGGSSDVGKVFEYRIQPVLKYYGIGQIDAWFLTHGDLDHVSGIQEALEENVPVHRIFLPDISEDEVLNEIQRKAELKGIEAGTIKPGYTALAGDFKLQCLYPLKEWCTGDKNNDSMVLKVCFELQEGELYSGESGEISILLTGDIETEGENILMEKIDIGQIDILKAAHHGSSGGTSVEFLRTVSPDWAIISCGEDNRYGHPHEETLKRLKDVECAWISTAVQGAIRVEVDRKGYELYSYRQKN